MRPCAIRMRRLPGSRYTQARGARYGAELFDSEARTSGGLDIAPAARGPRTAFAAARLTDAIPRSHYGLRYRRSTRAHENYVVTQASSLLITPQDCGVHAPRKTRAGEHASRRPPGPCRTHGAAYSFVRIQYMVGPRLRDAVLGDKEFYEETEQLGLWLKRNNICAMQRAVVIRRINCQRQCDADHAALERYFHRTSARYNE